MGLYDAPSGAPTVTDPVTGLRLVLWVVDIVLWLGVAALIFTVWDTRWGRKLWRELVWWWNHRNQPEPIRLSPRCWCGYHWGGFMTPADVENHNRVARRIVERVNQK